MFLLRDNIKQNKTLQYQLYLMEAIVQYIE
jgi:hypothetical protein